MKEKKDIEEKKDQIRLIEMLDHPEDFSEQDIKELFSDKANREYFHVCQLARRAYKRSKTTPPDVEEEWKKFVKRNTHAHKFSHKAAIIISRVISVAAVFVIIFLIFKQQLKENTPSLIKEEIKAEQEATGQKNISVHSSKGAVQIIPRQDKTIAYNQTPQNAIQSNINQDIKTIIIPKGKDLKVVLPDGTEVWLNAASSITFPVPFDDNKRELLLKGEAYFKVKHENKRPFIVTTGNISVTVLGTEFNIRSYKEESPSVTLVKGLVNLAGTSGKDHVLLHPNEQGILDSNGKLSVMPADTYAVTQWVEGYFYFDHTPLIKVVHELAHWYDLNILVRNKKFINEPIHFSAARKEDINNAIENLNRLQKACISIEGSNIVIH